MMLIGTQIAGLEKELTENLCDTLKGLHEIGFNAVEPLVLFNEEQGNMPKNLWAADTLNQAKSIMDELGMTIPSVYTWVGFGDRILPAEVAVHKMLEISKRIGVKYFVISNSIGTIEAAEKWGDLACKIAAGLKSHGCFLVYHNHDNEFTPITVDGETMPVLDYFFKFAGPDVLLQLDIGWAAMGGNEVDFARRYADRIVSLHLKDFYPGFRDGEFSRKSMPARMFAPIGTGVVKTADVLAMKESFPHFNGTILIDQDQYDGAMLDALKIGYCNTSKMLMKGGV